MRWRSVGEQTLMVLCSCTRWAMSSATSANKRWLRQLELLFLFGVLLAGRGDEGEGSDSDREASAASENHAAVMSCFTDGHQS
jgi:hypothetical protein